MFGRLPYRTLDFQFETLPTDCFQTHGTVNYTVDEDFTRITEFKHMTGQRMPGVTTIVREYSKPYTGSIQETPYYAIINEENNASTPSTPNWPPGTRTCTCWAGWQSTNTTIWTPSWPAPWLCPTNF